MTTPIVDPPATPVNLRRYRLTYSYQFSSRASGRRAYHVRPTDGALTTPEAILSVGVMFSQLIGPGRARAIRYFDGAIVVVCS